MSIPSKVNVKVSYTSEYHPLSFGQNKAINALKDYKQISLSEEPTLNFVAPPEGIQSMKEPVHPALGRDKVFEFPEHLINGIHKENLSHIHYSDGTWPRNAMQWDCTSNLALVYSGIKLSKYDYHFVVHDFLINEAQEQNFDAHHCYKQDMQYYIDNAEYYRQIIEDKFKANSN
ncbi:hypothetical protein [Vibrio sp. 10N.261.51.F12]|uniref:hypothetical protein n=1 Tax=Vibrio sp. 10N.261.51.F12 TaxID=3229679 RepID=UPI00354CD2AC